MNNQTKLALQFCLSLEAASSSAKTRLAVEGEGIESQLRRGVVGVAPLCVFLNSESGSTISGWQDHDIRESIFANHFKYLTLQNQSIKLRRQSLQLAGTSEDNLCYYCIKNERNRQGTS